MRRSNYKGINVCSSYKVTVEECKEDKLKQDKSSGREEVLEPVRLKLRHYVPELPSKAYVAQFMLGSPNDGIQMRLEYSCLLYHS